MSQRCGFRCLGPLTFHRAVGDAVHLSQGCCHAKRSNATFRNGLLFSNRPVRVQERVRLRVKEDSACWHGAMRVGFTSVSPDSRSLPLPSMAIPEIPSHREILNHWAAPVHEEFCKAGSQLEFWVSSSGSLYVSNQNGCKRKLLVGVPLKQTLWAMVDLYGQTRSVLLLGSKIGTRLFTRRSCQSLLSPVSDTASLTSDDSSDLNLLLQSDGEETICVVCMAQEADISLPCGHRCMCRPCAIGVLKHSGRCPLCRQRMKSSPEA
ncbi:E3 ubiquitin-protein ligase NEURL3-like isoform X2 [Hippocampus comes]|nr:PREDICTED: E3 ubiquitin-protein ligase NEURL3-like isoform X2 [Hippocampus comes]